MWGRRVVTPLGHLLDELHECHPVMYCMKALGRSFVGWPGIDQDIEDRVRFCEAAVLALGCSWQRIHVDFAEVKGQQQSLLIVTQNGWRFSQ